MAGVRVLAAFLCDACQREIASLDVSDARYPWVMQRLAAFWRTLARPAGETGSP